MVERRGVYRVLLGKPEGTRPRRRWEDNNKMDHQEVGYGVMDWINLSQLEDTCECANELSGSVKCAEFLD